MWGVQGRQGVGCGRRGRVENREDKQGRGMSGSGNLSLNAANSTPQWSQAPLLSPPNSSQVPMQRRTCLVTSLLAATRHYHPLSPLPLPLPSDTLTCPPLRLRTCYPSVGVPHLLRSPHWTDDGGGAPPLGWPSGPHPARWKHYWPSGLWACAPLPHSTRCCPVDWSTRRPVWMRCCRAYCRDLPPVWTRCCRAYCRDLPPEWTCYCHGGY